MNTEQPGLDPHLISLRDLSEDDIPLVVRYWFHSPPGFIESMGVDFAKMPKEPDMERSLREKVLLNRALPTSKLNALAIRYQNETIGFHTVNPFIEGDHGIFHAHLLKTELRGRGLGVITYPKACGVFLERFDLKRILFKTPVQNTGAIRVKEKLRIRCIGEEIISFSVYKDGTKAKVFELTRAEARSL